MYIRIKTIFKYWDEYIFWQIYENIFTSDEGLLCYDSEVKHIMNKNISHRLSQQHYLK